jgi:hypothetical protein
MNYKYPPVYKYIILLVVITSFLRYYKVITKENFLVIAGIFTYMTFVFDYIIIRNHPSLFTENIEIEKISKKKNDEKKKKKSKKSKKQKKMLEKFEDDKDDENIIDTESLDDKFDKDMKDLETQINNETDSDNLTEEIQRELDDLDLE